MGRQTLTEKLEANRQLIFNSRDTEVATLLEAIGVDSTYLDEGEALYQETMQLFEKQNTEYQEQSKAYDQFYTEKDAAEAQYRKTLKLVEILSRNDQDLQDRLQLSAGYQLRLEQWIDNAANFYTSLLNETEFLTKLARFKVTPEQLAAEKEAALNLRQLRDAAQNEKGDAQEATRARNEKLDALDDYSVELKGLAKLALDTRPQLLEKLGIHVRS